MKKFIKPISILALLILFLTPVILFAADPPPVQPIEPTDLPAILAKVRLYLLGITGAIIAICLIIGGVMYATAGGDQNRIAAAKAWVTNAVIGVIIIVLAYSIVQIIINLVSP